MKIRSGNGGAPAAEKPAAGNEPKAHPPVTADAPQIAQLSAFVTTIQAAVERTAAQLRAKGEAVPDALLERGKAAGRLLESVQSGKSLSPQEVAYQLNSLLWDLTVPQTNRLQDALTETAKSFGELAQVQMRRSFGIPGNLGRVVELLTEAGKTPRTAKDVERMIHQLDETLKTNPPDEVRQRLVDRKEDLEVFRTQFAAGEGILAPLKLPTTAKGAAQAVRRLTEKLGELEARNQAALGNGTTTEREVIEIERSKLQADLKVLDGFEQQLKTFEEPTWLDRSGFLWGPSVAWAIPLPIEIPLPLTDAIVPNVISPYTSEGVHVFEYDRALKKRVVQGYGAVGLANAWGGIGTAGATSEPKRVAKELKLDASRGDAPPKLAYNLNLFPFISVGQHPFHGKKVDFFVPGRIRVEFTESGGIGVTPYIPTGVPMLRVGVTNFIRTPALAYVTGPLIMGIEKSVNSVKWGWENLGGQWVWQNSGAEWAAGKVNEGVGWAATQVAQAVNDAVAAAAKPDGEQVPPPAAAPERAST